ncbi:reverse transcriptase domain-containing protein [Mucilaginibacter sp.]|uniref:reverse transcriptase domain-containing protein n=1 Tax=Mucilaginibacter sp. TaxID=1882438 RepID=UPI00283E77CE|nr:reverse transcriptase domain-containing protein [Mucilaginibacter sp.]MDR3693541.1 reverse transcriptase domain-containing protein [Mucilaginibacter sp.]
MDYTTYSEKFISKAQAVGYSSEVIFICLNYAKPLIDQNLPIIYNFRHLASLVGYSSQYLLRAATHTDFFYREFKIIKKNKNLRTISEPLPSLKEIQTWILSEILYKVDVSKFAKAYVPNSTIKQNIIFHRNMPLVFKLDITDFFSSIKSTSVKQIFNSLGYSHALSNLFSKLCCFDDQLPQGAPTSPYLSNLYLKSFDEKIGAFCLRKKIRYTRYSDDLTFSGTFDPNGLLNMVKFELNELKLGINESKIKLMTKGERQIVTGVVVNEKFQVAREKRKEIRQAMHYIQKFGLSDHLIRKGIERENYLEHLLGRINFVLYINRDDGEFIRYKDYLLRLKTDIE